MRIRIINNYFCFSRYMMVIGINGNLYLDGLCKGFTKELSQA